MRRRPRTTRLSSKQQATISVAVLAEAGVQAGERLRVEALGPGRIVLTRDEDSFDELTGTWATTSTRRATWTSGTATPWRSRP
jgi:hypothetical protein